MNIRAHACPIALFSLAVLAFVSIAISIESGGWVASVDGLVGAWLHARAAPSITAVSIAISFFGAPSTLTIVSIVVAVVLARHRHRDRAVAMLALVVGGDLLNYALKLVLHRDRPLFADPLLTLPSYSFPSGHAMASTVLYGFVVACVLPLNARIRGFAIAGGASMIALVGFSRVYLGVHYLSDVLAGMLEAVAWSALVLALWRHWRPARQRSLV